MPPRACRGGQTAAPQLTLVKNLNGSDGPHLSYALTITLLINKINGTVDITRRTA